MGTYDPTDEELAALTNVAYKQNRDKNANTVERIFADAAPDAARSILDLAENAASERVRLSAAQYVVDRVCGKIGDEKDTGVKSPLEELLSGVVLEPSAVERGWRPSQ